MGQPMTLGPVLPHYGGPMLVELLNGELVFSDAETFRHECEARAVLKMRAPNEYLFDIERTRGPDAAAKLRATMAAIEEKAAAA